MESSATDSASKFRRLIQFLGTGGGLAIAAGACVVFSFAPFGCGPLVFIAPLLLIVATRGRTKREAFLRGYVMGLVIEGGGFYWIAHTVAAFTSVHWLVACGVFCLWLLLSSILWGLWGAFLGLDWRWGWRWWGPALALGFLEMVFPRVFPWNLSSAFAGWPTWMQAAHFVSVEGLTVVTVFVSTCAYQAFRAGTGSERRWAMAVVISIVAAWWGGGIFRLELGEMETEPQVVRVGYVQPNVPLATRYSRDNEALSQYAHELCNVTRLVAQRDLPSFIVWPEAIWPGSSSQLAHPNFLGTVSVPVLVGVGERTENRIVLVPPADASTELGIYRKRVPLAFGERVPFRSLWEWTGFPLNNDVTLGTEIVVWDLDGVEVGVSVCFEGIVPETGRLLTEAGAQIHVNVTEDQWFGNTSEPHQHLALASMRAVESNLPMVRVTNTGVSSWIDRFGRVHGATQMFERDFGIYEVRVPPTGAIEFHSQLMFRYGRWIFALAIVLLSFGNASIRRELPRKR